MDVPAFRLDHHLSDWSTCCVEARCPTCGRSSFAPTKLLMANGDRTSDDLAKRLKCEACGARPAPVYLCSDYYRQRCKGISPSWAVEIVAPPEGLTAPLHVLAHDDISLPQH